MTLEFSVWNAVQDFKAVRFLQFLNIGDKARAFMFTMYIGLCIRSKTMTVDLYKASFEVKNAFGDVFDVTPFRLVLKTRLVIK